MISLDLETAPIEGDLALLPWHPDSRITMCAVGTERGGAAFIPGQIAEVLQSLTGRQVATWNGLFDTAFLMSEGHEDAVRKIKWVDGMLLWKWLENSQEKLSFSLVNVAKRHLTSWAHLDEFSEVKDWDINKADTRYWHRRAILDVQATSLLTDKALALLRARGYNLAAVMIQQRCIVPVAKSWLTGIRVDLKTAERMREGVLIEMDKLQLELGLSKEVLRSPKQLGDAIYGVWGLPPKILTETGANSTSKTALTYLARSDLRARKILRWRGLNTQDTKFLGGLIGLGQEVTHSAPHLFSTYTRRMTYSSSTKKKEGVKVGPPIHQWPRDKAVRGLIKPPEGMRLAQFDAAGQENRFMAALSGDRAMSGIFRDNGDIHSYTGAGIAEISYQEFLQRKAAGDPEVVGPKGLRYQGKFMNLSMQYRIGEESLQTKALVDYGLDLPIQTIRNWRAKYHWTYGAVKGYWLDSIGKAKRLGYAEALDGGRYYIDQWAEQSWSSEQSALNCPIQMSGAAMKEVAITLISSKFPEVEFNIDLHDGLFYLVHPEDEERGILSEIRQELNDIPYKTIWDWEPPFQMKWDAEVGDSWGNMREVS